MYEAEKKLLIEKAKVIYESIYPVINKKSFEECFTMEIINGETWLMFWYNDNNNSTHMEKWVI